MLQRASGWLAVAGMAVAAAGPVALAVATTRVLHPAHPVVCNAGPAPLRVGASDGQVPEASGPSAAATIHQAQSARLGSPRVFLSNLVQWQPDISCASGAARP